MCVWNRATKTDLTLLYCSSTISRKSYDKGRRWGDKLGWYNNVISLEKSACTWLIVEGKLSGEEDKQTSFMCVFWEKFRESS